MNVRKKLILLIVFILLACFTELNAAVINAVTDSQTATNLFYKAVGYVNNLGLKVNGKVAFFAVDEKTLDSLCEGSPYKGVELGLYMYKNWVHNIFAMYGLDPDRFMSTCAHEYTHAWQSENCPKDQDDVLREGFARWCEIKVLEADGAAMEAERYRQSFDPVYGNGYRLLLVYEDKNGQQAVIDLVKRIHNSSEIK